MSLAMMPAIARPRIGAAAENWMNSMRMTPQQIASNRRKKAKAAKMANKTKFTPRAREQFLRKLKETANVSHAAESIAMTRRRMYEIYNEQPDFAVEWDDAIESAVDALESEARRRGVEGVAEFVLYQGAVVKHNKKDLVIRKYSDHLLEQLLKAHRPEKFRERYDVNLKGSMTLEQAVNAAQVPATLDKARGSKT